MGRALDWDRVRRERLAREAAQHDVERDRQESAGPALITAQWGATCADCGGRIEPGESMLWVGATRTAAHEGCQVPEPHDR